VVPETSRPVVDADALALWCQRWLGAPPVAELFEAGYLSAVKGLRLADGREVVVKVRPRMPRLAGCTAVHRALWAAGFPCPEPLTGLEPLDGYAATAERLMPDAGEPPPRGELARLSAAGLARVVELGPDPGSVPSLVPSPSYAGWDHTEPGLWPAPEDRDVDLNACPGPRWLDDVAAAVRDLLRGHPGVQVIGHGDWHPENLSWQGSRLIAVHDWDSAVSQPEPAIAGLAAASFLGIDGPPGLASVADSAAFLDAYQRARGGRWTSGDCAAAWAAGLWQRVFDAKTRSLDGDPEQVLTRREARDRLRLAGLEPGLLWPFDRDGGGEAVGGAGLDHLHPHPVERADGDEPLGHALGRGLDQREPAVADNGRDRFRGRRVVERVGQVVGGRRAPDVGGHVDVEDQRLLDVALPVIRADDGPH
jgi:hypothetical protein